MSKSLKDKLQSDLKTAMKEKDKLKKQTIIMTRAAILRIEKDEKKELNEDEVLDVIMKQVKQRKDSLIEFEKAEREDLINDTKAEIDVLMQYLPKQLSVEELKAIIKEAIEQTGAKTPKDMGKIMGSVMPKVKGRADGKEIGAIAKELLSSIN